MSAILTDALSVRTELTVTVEAYPLSSSSSSDGWSDLLGCDEVRTVEEEGCSYLSGMDTLDLVFQKTPSSCTRTLPKPGL